jgi:hypothetical protein
MLSTICSWGICVPSIINSIGNFFFSLRSLMGYARKKNQILPLFFSRNSINNFDYLFHHIFHRKGALIALVIFCCLFWQKHLQNVPMKYVVDDSIENSRTCCNFQIKNDQTFSTKTPTKLTIPLAIPLECYVFLVRKSLHAVLDWEHGPCYLLPLMEFRTVLSAIIIINFWSIFQLA